jgi:hypothetical protein
MENICQSVEFNTGQLINNDLWIAWSSTIMYQLFWDNSNLTNFIKETNMERWTPIFAILRTCLTILSIYWRYKTISCKAAVRQNIFPCISLNIHIKKIKAYTDLHEIYILCYVLMFCAMGPFLQNLIKFSLGFTWCENWGSLTNIQFWSSGLWKLAAARPSKNMYPTTPLQSITTLKTMTLVSHLYSVYNWLIWTKITSFNNFWCRTQPPHQI